MSSAGLLAVRLDRRRVIRVVEEVPRRDVELQVRHSGCGKERLCEREVLHALLGRGVRRGEALPERVVVADLAGTEHHLRKLLRAIDHERDGSADARVLQGALVGAHAKLPVSGGRLRVRGVLRVLLEDLHLLRRELHREVDLPCPQREHHRGRPLVVGDLDTVERRLTAPIGVVPHEVGALLVDVVLELERAGADHAALDPFSRLRGIGRRLDDRLVGRLADEIREHANRRLEPEHDRVRARRRYT